MAVAAATTISKLFSSTQMQIGTDIDTWFQALSVSTLHGFSTCSIGNAAVLITVLYE
jgi:hypothetical protein